MKAQTTAAPYRAVQARYTCGRAGFWSLVILAIVVGATVWLLRPGTIRESGPSIRERAKQAANNADSLSAKIIPGDDLPPTGTRSLFDHLIAQNEVLPYPFEKLVALIQKQNPDGGAPLTLLIPEGRSLLKAQADFFHPRVLVAADFQAPDNKVVLGLASRGRLFMGFVENAHEIEIISYNEAAGRYEFQLVQDYRAGGQPHIVYARRAICTACHQAGAPIFPQRPWQETNGQPEIADRIRAERKSDAPYLGVAISNPLSVPERFDELAEIGNFVMTTQHAWIDGCGPAAACRRQMLKVALHYLWSQADFDDQSADAKKLRELQARQWPAVGIAVAEKSIPNRDPLAGSRTFLGRLRSMLTPKSHEPGARNNEDLAAFERLPKLPANLDPLSPRPPRRILGANDLDGAYGIAAMFTEGDTHLLEQVSGGDLEKLDVAVARLPDTLFTPAPFRRVATLKALLLASGDNTVPDYCCLSTAEMSPPMALGVPPLKISKIPVLKNFQMYCFACHRGNPNRKLDFMSGATEDEVLAHIKAKSEIRDVLDWPRYSGTDKANKMMPPADSHQRQALQDAVAKDPKLLPTMRNTVPALFDF